MFFILSKILYYLAMPFPWLFILLLLVYRYRNRPKPRNRILVTSIVLFFLLTNRFLANQTLQAWEYAPLPTDSVPAAEVGILLGGMVNQDLDLIDRPNYTNNADRIIQTAHLYKVGKIRKILVTGGTAFIDSASYQPEAELLLATLLEWGIPREDIWLETASLNTHQNARFSKAILDEKNITSPCILITSAFHMRRSVGCFEKQNIAVIPFPSDFETISHGGKYPANWFVPQEEAPPMYRRVFKELLGCIVYRLQGYL